jgi:hypothetical protein
MFPNQCRCKFCARRVVWPRNACAQSTRLYPRPGSQCCRTRNVVCLTRPDASCRRPASSAGGSWCSGRAHPSSGQPAEAGSRPFRFVFRSAIPSKTFMVRQVLTAASLSAGCCPRLIRGCAAQTTSGSNRTVRDPRRFSALLYAGQVRVRLVGVFGLLIHSSYDAGLTT